MKKLIELLKLDEKASEADVLTAVAALQAENAAFKADKKKLDEREKLVVEKMLKGLTRQQAITVIERQEHFDRAQAENPKPERKKNNAE